MLVYLNCLLQLWCQLDAVLLVNVDHGFQSRFPLVVDVSRLTYRESSSAVLSGLHGGAGSRRVQMGTSDGVSTHQHRKAHCEKCRGRHRNEAVNVSDPSKTGGERR